MGDDTEGAQARKFLSELYGHVDDVSRKLQAADERNRRAQARGRTRRDPVVSTLRRELREAHRLIDGLHRRYPQTAPRSTVAGQQPRSDLSLHV